MADTNPPNQPGGVVRHIRTRFAIVKRAEKILKGIDDIFEDAADFGLSVEEVDPRGELVAIRKGLIAMLEREGRLRGSVETEPHKTDAAKPNPCPVTGEKCRAFECLRIKGCRKQSSENS